jgi:polyphenol oxidase
VLLCDRRATVVAAAHAGWRGLCAGVLEAAVSALAVPPAELLAHLGPGIGPHAFEVGSDVREAFIAVDAAAAAHFVPKPPAADGEPKWLCDLPGLARRRLSAMGVRQVSGGDLCTWSDASRFFSHRRDRRTGRQAALIWLDP